MHIAEGFLPPLHAAAWTAVAAPFVIHGTRAISRTIKEHPEATLLLGAAGAFTFVLSAIKLPSVTGSSSHPTGAGLGAVIFRPPVMAALGTIVLLFQALLLAHGGLTTLGANVFSMAVVGPWVGYAAFRLLGRAPFSIRIFAAMALANLATYVMTATQLALAFPGQNGFVGAWSAFLGIFAITQVPLAVIEGLVGVLIFKALRSWAGPELSALGVFSRRRDTPAPRSRRPSMRKHASTLAILLAIVALFAVAMVLGTRQSTGDGETFIGTDSAATTHIEENHPGYTPWFQTIFEPSSGEVESGLFALQAALGAGALGFVLGTMRERRRQRRSAADDSSRPVSDPEPACDAAEPQSRG